MKYVLFLSACIALASCKKEYTCACTLSETTYDEFGPSTQFYGTTYHTDRFKNEEEARFDCDLKDSVEGQWGFATGEEETPTSGYRVENDCEL